MVGYRRLIAAALATSLVSLALAACGPEPLVAPAAAPSPAAELEPTATPTAPGRGPQVTESPTMSPNLQQAVDASIADLSQRLGIPAESITVVEAQEVVWPDASLGCAQPDMMYVQVLTPGYQVVLEADGQLYDYHGGSPDTMFLCTAGSAETPSPSAGGDESRKPAVAPGSQAAVDATVADAAARLGVPADSIQVVSMEDTVWPTSGLGCEKPGQMYLQVITPGYQIVLQAGDMLYTYHTNKSGRFVLCSISATN